MNPAARIYDLDLSRPCVMTVVNVTPDSYYCASRAQDERSIISRVESALADGAGIIDIGGCSTRPGSVAPAADEELRRVLLGVRCVREVSQSVPVSIDTWRSVVAARVLESYDRIVVNDVSGGDMDPAIVDVAVAAQVPYIAMHMRGTPATMSAMTDYDDVVQDVVASLGRKMLMLQERGMRECDIMLDPGFGFAKSTEQNFRLLSGLHEVCALGRPVVAGLSRKSMIYRTLGTTPDECLAPTAALQWEALREGAAILRVHDTRAAADTVRLYEEYIKSRR